MAPSPRYFPPVPRSLYACALLALVLSACHRTPKGLSDRIREESPVERASVLRVPTGGGKPSLYRIPDLTEDDWALREKLPDIASVLGVSIDDRLVYLLGDRDQVLALDLESRSVRTLFPKVRSGTVGPDGTLYAVSDSNRVLEVAHRATSRFTDPLPARPSVLFGGLGNELLVVTGGDVPAIVRLSGDQPIHTEPIPDGPTAATFWGDLVAVAADTAVVLYDPAQDPPVRSMKMSGHVIDVAFSPSGHRLYVLRREKPLAIIDRFNDDELDELKLPGEPAELRTDAYGDWLLIRSTAKDTAWIVDAIGGKVAGTVRTGWGPTLPAVVGGGILLTAEGGDVVGYDLSQEPWQEVGRVQGGASDRWVPLAWQPDDGTTTRAITGDTAVADTTAESGSPVYLQVSSSRNPDWAEDLARKLREAGLPAKVLPPRGVDDGNRVVLGPYPTRNLAEQAGRRLGRPFFIYQPDGE